MKLSDLRRRLEAFIPRKWQTYVRLAIALIAVTVLIVGIINGNIADMLKIIDQLLQ